MAAIQVRGARTHNLREVDVDLPRGGLVVLTGLSGSGKSSLAFDTIHAEGRRRYVESLAVAARPFLDLIEPPDVDRIEGLPPTVAIDQDPGRAGMRSLLASVVEIFESLRLLYARLGRPHCPRCRISVDRQTPERILETLLDQGNGRKLVVMAPMVRGRKGRHAETFQAIRRAGLLRVRLDGETRVLDEEDPKPNPNRTHDIEAVVDRVVVREGIRPRLADSLDLALKLGQGSVVVSVADDVGNWSDRTFHTRYACPDCGFSLPELEPRLFSFNQPQGACPSCDGLGERLTKNADQPPETCPDCQGARLKPEARAVTVQGLALPKLLAQTVAEARATVASWRFEPPWDRIAPPILAEVQPRLEALGRLGLDDLTLDRPAPSLSGGELRRARLAARLGSGLVGTCYVLDEPTAGLHPRDTARLLACLRDLRDQGNSVLVVEHDEETIRAADHVVDLGPGAGPEGGRIVAEGPPDRLVEREPGASPTKRWLERDASRDRAARARPDRLENSPGRLRIRNAQARNLKGIDVEIPLGTLTAVSGVSGSGKSTLVFELLAREARRFLNDESQPASQTKIEGLETIEALVEVNQAPIGRGPRSTPATYVGLFDAIRNVFAQTREARARGYAARRFSFNVAGGRCEACEGQGVRRLDLSFLPDAFVTCDQCRGLRFNAETLQARFKGRSIGEVLRLRVEEALDVFANVPPARMGLEALQQAGLGYLTLGQSSATLSGGEAQRVKLAAEWVKPSAPGRTLFLLDEPTTGLHALDVEALWRALERLANAGNTVVVVEHNPQTLRSADWLIDLGPEGGLEGGSLVAMGTPSEVATAGRGHTARFLE